MAQVKKVTIDHISLTATYELTGDEAQALNLLTVRDANLANVLPMLTQAQKDQVEEAIVADDEPGPLTGDHMIFDQDHKLN